MKTAQPQPQPSDKAPNLATTHLTKGDNTMTTPHKHADLIRAWADGAEIEFLSSGDYTEGARTWRSVFNPGWDSDTEYRIKPAPKPNTVTWHALQTSEYISCSEWTRDDAANYVDITRLLRIEIDHNDPANPKLVSATLEKP